jgi:hypothetical protein
MAKDPLYTDESLRTVRLFSLEEERNWGVTIYDCST